MIEEERLVERAARLGERLLAGLREAARPHRCVAEVRGRGLMVGIEFADPETLAPRGDLAKRVLAEAFARGLLLLPCGTHGQVVRVIPPLVTTDDEVDRSIGILGESFGAADA